MSKAKKTNRRVNKSVGLGEALSKIIEPVFQKRGFASRDIINQWRVIAPEPYNKVTIPERLQWSGDNKSAEGAILVLRCASAYKMALTYDSKQIAGAINRYFGYVLVDRIKISLEPFSLSSGEQNYKAPVVTREVHKKISDIVCDIEDEQLKNALQKLGEVVVSKGK